MIADSLHAPREDQDDNGAVEVSIVASCWRAQEKKLDCDFSSLLHRAAAATLPLTLSKAQLSIILADDTLLADLNERWRGKKGPTNVLSFPLQKTHGPTHAPIEHADSSGPPFMLGDVVLSYQTIAREAAEQGKSLADHLVHLAVHGILHLLGWTHDEEEEAREMEKRERDILARLGIKDPYCLADFEAGAMQ